MHAEERRREARRAGSQTYRAVARQGAAGRGRARADDVAVAEQWLGRLEEDVVEVGEEHLLGVVEGLQGF